MGYSEGSHRGQLISYISKIKKEIKSQLDKFSVALREAYTNFQTCTSPLAKYKWQVAKHTYEIWLDRKER